MKKPLLELNNEVKSKKVSHKTYLDAHLQKVVNDEKKECNENWHIFQPSGAKVCNCGKSTDNPLNKLADEANKYNL